jgi:hypothetical protein
VDAEQLVRQKWRLLKATLDERGCRLWAGAEADAIGRGGVAQVARATELAISVDTKKKELVGNFKNGGREWQPACEPELVDVHDFPGENVVAQGYPTARELFITADAGGSNRYRSHVWKQQLQRLADTLNLKHSCEPFPTRH